MTCLARWLCVLLLAVVSLPGASAQQITANIRGAVTDPSGAVVSAVAITATQKETGFTRTVTSDQQGAYLLVELPVGHYELRAEANGFQKFVQDGISLDVNQTAAVAIHLVVGMPTQEVHVQANASLVETAVTSLGKTVQEREILGLPLNERHFTQLGLLQPGV
ncbi:MAG TPA: carboxypeptidase-like regulatory domain-containing protein, partial [Candidatus Acidoferrum sp.]